MFQIFFAHFKELCRFFSRIYLKSYVWFRILNTDPPSIHIREYKYFVKSGDLPEYDKPKIEAYKQIAANHGTVELEGKNYSIAKVEYIFSNKGAFDENKKKFNQNVESRYISGGKLN